MDDSTVSVRVAGFLAARAERWPGMPVEQIPLSARAYGPQGLLAAVPEDLIRAAVSFEERYGGLRYQTRHGGNPMEYGLDGQACFRWSPGFSWSMPALLDGSWTWGLSVLLNGRTIMGPGQWADRLIDRSLEQRLEKHALLAEVSDWPHTALGYTTSTGVLPDIGLSGIPEVVEATGPADSWWYDGDSAVHLGLVGWPEGQDRWVLRCFARTEQHLSEVLKRVSRPGSISDWCSICLCFLQPTNPSHAAQGDRAYCLPTRDQSADR
jgi:hypothetical protein